MLCITPHSIATAWRWLLVLGAWGRRPKAPGKCFVCEACAGMVVCPVVSFKMQMPLRRRTGSFCDVDGHILYLKRTECRGRFCFPGTFLPYCGVRAGTYRRHCMVNSGEWAHLTRVESASTCPWWMGPPPPLTFLSPWGTIKLEVIPSFSTWWLCLAIDTEMCHI